MVLYFGPVGDELKGVATKGTSTGSAECDISRSVHPGVPLSYGDVGLKACAQVASCA